MWYKYEFPVVIVKGGSFLFYLMTNMNEEYMDKLNDGEPDNIDDKDSPILYNLNTMLSITSMQDRKEILLYLLDFKQRVFTQYNSLNSITTSTSIKSPNKNK